MTGWLADTPIRRKITVLMVVTAALALVGAGAALGGYEVITFRRALAQKLTTVADIIGRNCTAALAFGDKTVARDVLGALEAEPSVESGSVYDRGGQVFATYRPRPNTAAVPSTAASDGAHFTNRTVVVVRPIVLDGERVGTVYLQATLDELWRRMLLFTAVMAGIVVVSTLLALLLSTSLQRWIADPVLSLAATARRVASDRDFALRAASAGRDEVGTLIEDFNRMLGEIEQQDRQLRLQQEQLESEVAHRTAELVAANDQLTTSVQRAERYADQISQLTGLGQLLQSCQTPAEIYNVVQHAMGRLFPSDSGALAVLNSSRNLLEVAATWGDAPPSQRVFGPGECWAFRLGRPHLVSHEASALRCAHSAGGVGVVTLCVPMHAQGDNLGVLQLSFGCVEVGEMQDNTGFVQSTRGRLVLALAEQIALALANLRLREALRNQSIIDPLTGLFNRRYLEQVLERECRRALRSNRSLAVLMLDVDHFKRFNDLWGHEGGDAVLRDMASLMRHLFRGEDVACRYGGEEFVLLLADATLESACARADELRQAVHGLAVQHRGQTVGAITVSVGIAVLPEHGIGPSDLIAAADRALYRAKETGRDRTVCADYGMSSSAAQGTIATAK
jgi:diguanylate cyclase (GGDEF)-like protein